MVTNIEKILKIINYSKNTQLEITRRGIKAYIA